jgi:tetratricopeptide (TPR) repeat protein
MVQLAPPSSRLHRVATATVEVCWLATLVLVPLAVNPWGFNYGLPKVAVFRGLTLLMLAAHLLALAWSPTLPDPRHWLRQSLILPILPVAGAVLLSTVTSLSPHISLAGSYYRQQGTYLVLCFVLWTLLVATCLRTPAQQRRLTTTITLAGSIVAFTPFIEALRWQENPLTWRPGGSLGNPIFLGAYLITTIPFTLAQVVSSFCTPNRWRGWRALTSLALALQVFALLVTQSRGPWAGMVVGLALFVALVLWPAHRRVVLGGLAVGAFLVGGLLAGLKLDVVPVERLSGLPYVGRVAGAIDTTRGTARVRVVLWEMARSVVTAWPEVGLEPDRLHILRPVVGYGPDTASAIYTAAYPPELAHIEDPGAFWDRAHNEVLDVLTMRGWLGLAAWAVLGIACARRGLALWRTATGPAERAWAAAPLATLAAHVVEVQFAFSITATTMMGWLCVAWLAAPSPSLSGESAAHAGRADVARGLRWRVYVAVGALLLALLAMWLEGGALLADVLVARARALDRASQWEESVELYNRALAVTPQQAMYHQFRAEAFYNLARVLPDGETALKAKLLGYADNGLARARQLEPLDVELYSNSGILHAYWSEVTDSAGHLEVAVAFYQQAFRLAPTLARLRVDLGHIYHSHGRYEDALAQYDDALGIDPQSADAYYGAGLAWQALGRRDLAQQALQDALELAPDCEACRDALQTLKE